MENIPDKIYLQIGEDAELLVGEDFGELYDVTWCQDKINDTDIEYIRVEKKDKII